ncbi:MAG TPA: PHP domain-containing protein, partial [bacterium]|nr:PHP domain-containing protein [bacterium]
MSPPFAHLHLHTQYSLLDGAIRLTVPEDVRRAGVAFRVLPDVLQEQGFAACAITDTGNLFGAIEFYKTLKKAGIKPIIGMEALIVESRATGAERGRAGLAELVLLCQDREGYQNLVQLASLGYTQGRPGQPPCLEPALLERHGAGLIALSSHREGVLGKPLEAGDEERARQAARWYAQVFSGRFYVELQEHGLPAEQRLNGQLVSLARELDLPLVGTNGCRYLLPEEAYPHYILQLMGRQQKVTDRAAPPFVDGQLYLKSPQEMAEALQAYPEQAYGNAGAIAESCELDLSVHKTYLPRYEIPPDSTEEQFFRRQAQAGLERRIAQLAPAYGVPADPAHAFWQPYRERLEYELGVIVSMHYAG